MTLNVTWLLVSADQPSLGFTQDGPKKCKCPAVLCAKMPY